MQFNRQFDLGGINRLALVEKEHAKFRRDAALENRDFRREISVTQEAAAVRPFDDFGSCFPSVRASGGNARRRLGFAHHDPGESRSRKENEKQRRNLFFVHMKSVLVMGLRLRLASSEGLSDQPLHLDQKLMIGCGGLDILLFDVENGALGIEHFEERKPALGEAFS